MGSIMISENRFFFISLHEARDVKSARALDPRWTTQMFVHWRKSRFMDKFHEKPDDGRNDEKRYAYNI